MSVYLRAAYYEAMTFLNDALWKKEENVKFEQGGNIKLR